MFSSWGSSPPGVEFVSLASPPFSGRFFTTNAAWEALGSILELISYNNLIFYCWKKCNEGFIC